MPATSTNREPFSWLKALVLCLCAAVFTWGLQAKLSLYIPAAPLNPAHVAKLMADNQVTKRVAVAAAGYQSRAPRLVFVALFAFLPHFRAFRGRQALRLVLPTAPSRIHSLLFRPPPALL